ncbi:hypothetical protein A7E78_12545 [Syntrophotalea acetylenivorans]|uniref:Uncharacterized protein n=1 Tax=Syntrophotalea acetylenivorans TaxID=1842532 RepID=A0A1L3GRN6_9BACT|nr:hypothetical protein A7E78_12545 [Syntrophotalea acetylenivorans]
MLSPFPTRLIHSRKLPEWLSKYFDLQGQMYFQGRRHTPKHVEVLKKRLNAVGRNFCDAIKFSLSYSTISLQLIPNRAAQCQTFPYIWMGAKL